MGFVLHGPRPKPSHPCHPVQENPVSCTGHRAPWWHGVTVGGDAGPGDREHARHTTPCHLPFSLEAEATGFFPSQIHLFFWKKHLAFFGSSTEVLVVVWELLLHLSHGLDFERVPGILISQFLGTRNVKKLESVCMCEASLKFVRLKKKSPPYLKKKTLLGFVIPMFLDDFSPAEFQYPPIPYLC